MGIFDNQILYALRGTIIAAIVGLTLYTWNVKATVSNNFSNIHKAIRHGIKIPAAHLHKKKDVMHARATVSPIVSSYSMETVIVRLTVCIRMSNMLALSLLYSAPHVNHTIVITTESDVATHKLCQAWKIECWNTNNLGPIFNKGAAIAEAQKILHKRKGYIVIMDPDIAVPPSTWSSLPPCDHNTLYSVIDRHLFKTVESYCSHKPDGRDIVSKLFLPPKFQNLKQQSRLRGRPLKQSRYFTMGFFQAYCTTNAPFVSDYV